jgi:DNA-binding response OmpR family regulator
MADAIHFPFAILWYQGILKKYSYHPAFFILIRRKATRGRKQLSPKNKQAGLMRIFIASTDEKLRLAMLLFLENEPGMIVVGLSDRLPGLIAQLAGSQPDVLILDGELSSQPVKDLLSDLSNLEQRPRTIILTSETGGAELIRATSADYLISKNAPPDELLPILEQIRISMVNKIPDQQDQPITGVPL